MSSADVLRTPGLAQALQDGADALDKLPQLTATIDGLETSLSAATQRIADLEAQIAAQQPRRRFGFNGPSATLYAQYVALLGQPGAVRYYLQPGEHPHMPTEFTVPDGALLIESSKIKPQDVVVGQYDQQFHDLFTALGDNVFCPWHEPEDDVEAGRFTVAQYQAMWDHLTPIARQTKVRLAPILMRATYAGQKGRKPADYLPSDYDFVGVDAYVAGSIGVPAAQVGSLLDPVRAAAPGKRILVGEFGVGQKVTGQARADLIGQCAGYFRQAADVEAVCWFFGDKPATIEWRLSAAEAAAWKAAQTG